MKLKRRKFLQMIGMVVTVPTTILSKTKKVESKDVCDITSKEEAYRSIESHNYIEGYNDNVIVWDVKHNEVVCKVGDVVVLFSPNEYGLADCLLSDGIIVRVIAFTFINHGYQIQIKAIPLSHRVYDAKQYFFIRPDNNLRLTGYYKV